MRRRGRFGDERLALDGRWVAIIFVLVSAFSLPLACSLKISVSGNAGTVFEEIKGADGDAVFGRTVIGGESLSHAIKGGGSLKANHMSAKSAGAYTELGVDINEG